MHAKPQQQNPFAAVEPPLPVLSLQSNRRFPSDLPMADTAEASEKQTKPTYSELKFEELSIADQEAVNKTLEEPEDCSIEAVKSGDTPYTSAATFEDLNLSPELLQGLYAEMKFQKPSKIQAISLPMILTPPCKDLVVQAHNGSGKTTCFVLAMLSRVDPQFEAPQALCVCPTRELSLQNLEVMRKMGKYTGITSYAAVPLDLQNEKSRDRSLILSQVVIGTPGTIKRLMSQKILSVRTLKILVFDEADHMLAKDGFQDDSLRIMKDIGNLNAECQVLLFSATSNEVVKNFVARVVKDYNQLFVKKEELSLESVKQFKVRCPHELAKIMVIKDRILEFGEKVGQFKIFVNSKQSASMLHHALVEFGYEVTTVHDALSDEQRDQIAKAFKDGRTHVLISPHGLARGFDQPAVNLVINYDVPSQFENPSEPDYERYLHRSGRAGRFGQRGAVFNLLMTDRDDMLMGKIETYFGTEVAEVKSWKSEEDFKAALNAARLV